MPANCKGARVQDPANLPMAHVADENQHAWLKATTGRRGMCNMWRAR
jgi:hypothetical protein